MVFIDLKMIARGEFRSLVQAETCIKDLKKFKPEIPCLLVGAKVLCAQSDYIFLQEHIILLV